MDDPWIPKLLWIRKKISSLVPPWADRDGILESLLIDYFSKGTDISSTAILHRCIDERRKAKRERKVLDEAKILGNCSCSFNDPFLQHRNDFSLENLVTKSLSSARLSGLETLVIYNIFYLSLTIEKTSQDLNLSVSKISDLKTSALQKLRKEIEKKKKKPHGK